MPYTRIPDPTSQTPGYLCQMIIDAAYYHADDPSLMNRQLYEAFRSLHAQGIAPRADSKSGYVLMVGGEDKHVYAEVRLADTVRRAAVIERINNFKITDKPPVSVYLYESVASDVSLLAYQIIAGFPADRNMPTMDENKRAYAALVDDFRDFAAHDATLTLTPNNHYVAGVMGRMTIPSTGFGRDARMFAGAQDRGIVLSVDTQRGLVADLVRDMASQAGLTVAASRR